MKKLRFNLARINAPARTSPRTSIIARPRFFFALLSIDQMEKRKEISRTDYRYRTVVRKNLSFDRAKISLMFSNAAMLETGIGFYYIYIRYHYNLEKIFNVKLLTLLNKYRNFCKIIRESTIKLTKLVLLFCVMSLTEFPVQYKFNVTLSIHA